MSKRSKVGGYKLPPFTAIIRHTTKSDAWRALSMGARATFLALQSFYNTKSQDAVWLSARDGATELGCRKENIGRWLAELVFYGFTEKVKDEHLAGLGKGEAAHYRLTDRWYAGKPPTYDYDKWDGVMFEPKRKVESPARIARLKELNERHKNASPVSGSETPCIRGGDIRENPQKPKKATRRIRGGDIRDDQGCIRVGDVSTLPSDDASSVSSKLPWSTPELVDITDTLTEADIRALRLGRGYVKLAVA
jgi:hypothetical protein